MTLPNLKMHLLMARKTNRFMNLFNTIGQVILLIKQKLHNNGCISYSRQKIERMVNFTTSLFLCIFTYVSCLFQVGLSKEG